MFNTIERGIIERARKAGFQCTLQAGRGPAGHSRRITAARSGIRSGLVRFSLTRLSDDSLHTYVQFIHWSPRPAKLAELRAELALIAELERNHPS